MISSDVQVQRTNDDAVLSKRSASKLGYFEDEYLKHLAAKLVRRSPLINKGYYLRAAAMRQMLRWFTETHHGALQVVGIGCGFDTAAYRLAPSVASRTHYFEVDYADVLARKRDLLAAAGAVPLPVVYHAIGCDIRNSADLVAALTSHGFNVTTPTIFMAECVLQYVSAAASEGVLQAMRVLMGPGEAVFAIFDQITPTDTFGDVMQKTLRARSSPLLGIDACGTVALQESRLERTGWDLVRVLSFVDVNDAILRSNPEEIARVAKIESHDEHEDWVETCRHYCLSIGATRRDAMLPFQAPVPPVVATYPISARTASALALPRSMKFTGYGHASLAFRDGTETKVITFGGHVNEMRSSDVYVYDVSSGVESRVAVGGGVKPTARVHHAMATLTPTSMLLFGGRGSPDQPLGDTFILDCLQMQWMPVKVERGPGPRYRHSMCSAGDVGDTRVVLFGGRGTGGRCCNDLWVFAEGAWSEVRATGVPPSPRHSCAVAYLNPKGALLVSGGLSDNGHVLSDMFLLDVRTWTWTQLVLTAPTPALFSHTLTYIPAINEVLVLGGVHESHTYTDRNTNVLLLSVETMAFHQVTTVAMPTTCKHQAVLIPNTATVYIIGGGFQCFSFGVHLPKGMALCFSATGAELQQQGPESAESTVAVVPAASTTVSTWEHQLYAARRPVVFRGADLGACLTLWKDPAYLAEKEGAVPVSVHVPNAADGLQLDFVRRNFTYQTVPFRELVEACFVEGRRSTMYFRSIARQRGLADVWSNFPNIGRDFTVPSLFHTTVTAPSKYSQSCLRMNAEGVQLWTHYDVMDNILCQVTGVKRVVLYPPSQYGNLYVEGSTSRVIDIDSPDLARFPKFPMAQRKAVEVMLHPGDVLFIPAMWFHNVTATTASISVNIFWRHLSENMYDAKDTYGNRDLPCMVAARERIARDLQEAVREVPSEYRAFVLRQALDDLERTLH